MTHDYLHFAIDLNRPDVVSAYDEAPLWSAMSGLLLLDHVPMRPDMRVLDVGCGTGFPLLQLAQRLGPSSHVTGIDVWDAALDRARAKAAATAITNVTITHADASALPFDDGAFDLVVSNLGLNNFADAAAAVRECRRVLADGGTLALTTNLQGHMREFYDIFARTLDDLGESAAVDALAAHVAHRATIARVTELLTTAGFANIVVHERTAMLRYADGSALLNSYFIKLGFLGAWKQVVSDERRVAVFERLESNLNIEAEKRGGLALTIPLAYIAAEKAE